MKRIFITSLMLVAVLIAGVAGTRSAYAEGPVTANLGVSMDFSVPLSITSNGDLKFRLSRDASLNGHYVGLHDSSRDSANYQPGNITILGPPRPVTMGLTISPVTLTDGNGHTATLHLEVIATPAQYPENAFAMSDIEPIPLFVNYTDNYQTHDAEGHLVYQSAVNIVVKPYSLIFADGSDVLGEWTGTSTMTFDFVD